MALIKRGGSGQFVWASDVFIKLMALIKRGAARGPYSPILVGMSIGREWLVVTDPRAAAFLLDPDRMVLLKPFMRGPCAVHDAAAQLGVAATELYYPVKRMHELGILEVAFKSPRRGRPLKHYRASAQAFFVPFRVTSLTSIEDFLIKTEEVWSRQLARSLANTYTEGVEVEHWGLRILYEDGFIRQGLALDPTLGAPSPPPEESVVATWDTSFYLSESDVLELAEEVRALLERYRGRSGPRRVVRFAVAPWDA